MNLSDEMRTFLAEKRFAVVATINPDGSAQQTVMWYELQGDEILLNTAQGRVKERNLRRDPRLSLCVAEAYRAVTIDGQARLIDDQAVAQPDIARLAVRYHGPEKGARQAEKFRRQVRVTVRLPLEHVIPYGFDGDD